MPHLAVLPLLAVGLPPLFKLVFELLAFCAVLAVVWWGVNRLSVPEPIKTVVLVVMALIGLFVLWQLVMGGGVFGS